MTRKEASIVNGFSELRSSSRNSESRISTSLSALCRSRKCRSIEPSLITEWKSRSRMIWSFISAGRVEMDIAPVLLSL